MDYITKLDKQPIVLYDVRPREKSLLEHFRGWEQIDVVGNLPFGLAVYVTVQSKSLERLEDLVPLRESRRNRANILQSTILAH